MYEPFIRYRAEEKGTIVLTVKRSELSISESLKRLGIPRRSLYKGMNNIPKVVWKLFVTAIDRITKHGTAYSMLCAKWWWSFLWRIRSLPQGNSPFCFWRRVRSLSQNRVFIVFCVKEDSWRGRNTVLSMPPMSFAIRLGLPMRCGRPTLPTSRSRAGDCYYLSTVMDYYSRYIIHWELCSSMTGEDDSRTIDRAIKSAGLTAHNPPKLLSDN